MSLRLVTPCDYAEHICPYATDDGSYVNCEYWCGAEEPEPDYEEEDEEPW